MPLSFDAKEEVSLTAVDQAIDQLLTTAELEGVPPQKLVARFRQRERDSLLAEEMQLLNGMQMPTMPPPQWDGLKDVLRSPALGQAQLGQVLRAASMAVRTNDQRAFWRTAILTLRMLRRHLPDVERDFGA